MITWLNKSGQEVETNDNPLNIKAAKASGWVKKEEAKKAEVKKGKK